MNEKTFMEGGAQREEQGGAEWAIGSVIIPIIFLLVASVTAGMGGLYLSISNLSERVSTQEGVITTAVPFLKKEHENIRAELGEGYDKLRGELSTNLTVHYYEGHNENGGG